jgi:hypothetical protein
VNEATGQRNVPAIAADATAPADAVGPLLALHRCGGPYGLPFLNGLAKSWRLHEEP